MVEPVTRNPRFEPVRGVGTMRSLLSGLVLGLVVLSLPWGEALAGMADARRYYRAGRSLYKKKAYRSAVRALTRAVRAVPRSKKMHCVRAALLYNLARAQVKAGRGVGAVRSLEWAARVCPRGKASRPVNKMLRRIRPKYFGRLVVNAKPRARIYLNGKRRGRTPWAKWVPARKYRVRLRARGRRSARFVALVRRGRVSRFTRTLASLGRRRRRRVAAAARKRSRKARRRGRRATRSRKALRKRRASAKARKKGTAKKAVKGLAAGKAGGKKTSGTSTGAAGDGVASKKTAAAAKGKGAGSPAKGGKRVALKPTSRPGKGTIPPPGQPGKPRFYRKPVFWIVVGAAVLTTATVVLLVPRDNKILLSSGRLF